jgi:hypothetical protein
VAQLHVLLLSKPDTENSTSVASPLHSNGHGVVGDIVVSCVGGDIVGYLVLTCRQVGLMVGDLVGDPVGNKLGLFDGKASAQERQHIRETDSWEHLWWALSLLTAQSQVLEKPSSVTLNFALPAASPVHEEQQLPQQFNATSGRAHLSSLSSESSLAQLHVLKLSKPDTGNSTSIASPLHSDGHGVVGDIVGFFVLTCEQVGLAVGDFVGDPVGNKLGLFDGKASAQERQHIRETDSREHLWWALSLLTAQSQVLEKPSSVTLNFALPAASPVHDEQQLPQQFNATSGRAHLASLSSGFRVAQSHVCFPTTPRIRNFSEVASPLQSDGQGEVVGGTVGLEGFLLGNELGLSDGIASEQVRQHIRETESREHLHSEFFFTAQSQLAKKPNSVTLNFSSPAASPMHEEQQLPQQFNATSGRAHLVLLNFGNVIAQSHVFFPSIPEIENFSVIPAASPLHSDEHDGGWEALIIGSR